MLVLLSFKVLELLLEFTCNCVNGLFVPIPTLPLLRAGPGDARQVTRSSGVDSGRSCV